MQNEHVTINVPLCVTVNSKTVKLKDIVEIAGTDAQLVSQLKDKIFHVFGENEERAVISAITITAFMENAISGLSVHVCGETEILLKYKAALTKKNQIFNAFKVVFVSLAIFFGAAFTIMTFNSDVDVGGVFDTVYRLIDYGNKENKILEISYSVGIFAGVMLFFNHMSKKKMKADPTPIVVQMESYEQSVNQTIIEEAVRSGEVK